MAETVRNDSLGNFATNRDQALGKAIAEAASALSNNIQKPGQSTDTAIEKKFRSEKSDKTENGKS